MKVIFLFPRIYDSKGERRLIGGIETYVGHLIELVTALGMDAVLLQPAAIPFTRSLNGGTIIGLPIEKYRFELQKQLLYDKALAITDSTDLIIFAADHYSVPTSRIRAISIQHGIHWDLPISQVKRLRWLWPRFRSKRGQDKQIGMVTNYFNNCQNRVCVDHNFPNWYRATYGTNPAGRVWVIPNCSTVIPWEQISRNEQTKVSVLFARRFEAYRGTRVMANAVSLVLSESNNIDFTFAGDGTDSEFLENRFKGELRVRFIRYSPEESSAIHLRHQIAVVPSLGSEGTTLAATEAMGAGCAVIASPVGGLTNIILDGFNGVFAAPEPRKIADAVLSLARDKPRRDRLVRQAHHTAVECFALPVWQQRWREVIDEVATL